MTSGNLDLVRSIHAAWERGDYSSAGWADREIDYVVVDGPAPGTWTGLAEMAEAFRDFLDAWEEFSVAVEEYRQLDDERVLVVYQRSGRGKASGLEIAGTRTQGATLFHLRAGKVIKLVIYWDRERALTELWREGYEGWARDA
jgi:ketosteroid isomerase-like protein